MAAQVFGFQAAGKRSGFNIVVDDSQIQALIQQFGRGLARKIIYRSLNVGIRKANTISKRLVSKKRNIKVGTAARQLKVKPASPRSLSAEITASGKPIPLIDTKGAKTQTRRGVKANPGTGRRLFKSAFITRYKGHLGIFERVFPKAADKSKRIYIRKGPPGERYTMELPIREIRLPSLASTLIQRITIAQIDQVAVPAVQDEIQRLTVLEINKGVR